MNKQIFKIKKKEQKVVTYKGILDYKEIPITEYEDQLKILILVDNKIEIAILHKVTDNNYNINFKGGIIGLAIRGGFSNMKIYQYVIRNVINSTVIPIIRSQWKNIHKNYKLLDTIQYHLNLYEYPNEINIVRARLDIPYEKSDRPAPEYNVGKVLLTEIIHELPDGELKNKLRKEYGIYGNKTARRKTYSAKDTSK